MVTILESHGEWLNDGMSCLKLEGGVKMEDRSPEDTHVIEMITNVLPYIHTIFRLK